MVPLAWPARAKSCEHWHSRNRSAGGDATLRLAGSSGHGHRGAASAALRQAESALNSSLCSISLLNESNDRPAYLAVRKASQKSRTPAGAAGKLRRAHRSARPRQLHARRQEALGDKGSRGCLLSANSGPRVWDDSLRRRLAPIAVRFRRELRVGPKSWRERPLYGL